MGFWTPFFALAVMISTGEHVPSPDAYKEPLVAMPASTEVAKRPVNAVGPPPPADAPAAPAAEERYPRFADLPWGASGATVKKTLSAKGYRFEAKVGDVDQNWKGTVAGHETAISCVFNPQGELVSVLLWIEPDRGSYWRVYREMVDSLTVKYGAPTTVMDRFDYPFQDGGDDNRDLALHSGKAHFASWWGSDTQLMVGLTKKETILIAYCGPGWPAESARRDAISKEDL
jgi:hypothetical protein